MANAGKVSEGSSLADEWDMTSLTTSVYTSPLLQTGFDSVHVPKYGNVSSSRMGPYPGLFISDDFVFPPSEHENLPIEFEVDVLNTDTEGLDGSCARSSVEGCNERHQEVEGNSDENPFLSSDLSCVKEATSSDLKLSEIHADQAKNSSCGKSDLPCEGWWQRKSTHVFHHIKGVTTVSIVAAGALVGFVIMGQRWQQDRWHLHQFQFSGSGENYSATYWFLLWTPCGHFEPFSYTIVFVTKSMNRVMGLFSRLKDGLPGSQQLRSLLPTRVFSQQPLSA